MNDIIELPPLDYLRSYVIFVDSRNIVEASARLQISQPLLSKQLKAIEEKVGYSLFEFSGRKKVLTYLGKNFYDLIKSNLERLSAEMRQLSINQNQSKPVRIGGRKEILETLALNLVYETSVTYLMMDSEMVADQLIKKKIDIGISQKEIISDRLIRKKLWSDEFVLCWNPKIGEGLGKNYQDTLSKLISIRCYDYSAGSPLQAILKRCCLKVNAPLTTISDWRIIADLTERKKAWSVLPIGYAAKSTQLKTMKLPPELSHKSDFFVYYQKEFSKSPWFLELIAAIKRVN